MGFICERRFKDYRLMTDDQIRTLLLRRAKPFARRRGSSGVRAWAEAHGVNHSHVSEFMTGNRGPFVRMLDILDLETRIVRKRKASST